MAIEAARRLKRFCDGRAGQLLRGVFVYDDDGVETVYLRDDVRAAYTEEGVAVLAEAARRIHKISMRVGASGSALGDLDGHVHAFEHAHVLQIPMEDDRGVIVSFDREVGGQLAGFIQECLANLEE